MLEEEQKEHLHYHRNNMSVPNDLCFFWYTYSPYARKVAWYLALRGLAYAQCVSFLPAEHA
jgi:hypothetical protein